MCHCCQKGIVLDVINEIPEHEVESKWQLRADTQPSVILDTLRSYFTSHSPAFTLYLCHNLAATTLIDKFSSLAGTFSLLYRQDGTVTIKRKREKIIISKWIILCREERFELAEASGSLNAALDIFNLSAQDVTYLGRLRREKESLVIVSRVTGRVYTLLVDTTSIEVLGQEHSPSTGFLRQMELEYKGRDRAAQSGDQLSREIHTLVHAICVEIEVIRKEINHHLKHMHIVVRHTTQTKTHWLRKHGQALLPTS